MNARRRLTRRSAADQKVCPTRLAMLDAFGDGAGYGVYGFDLMFGVQENLCSAHAR